MRYNIRRNVSFVSGYVLIYKLVLYYVKGNLGIVFHFHFVENVSPVCTDCLYAEKKFFRDFFNRFS